MSVCAVFRIRIHLMRIRIQHFRLNTDPDSDPSRNQGFDDPKIEKIDPKIEKFTVKKIYFFLYQKLQYTYP
jgi:hypothetical protein